LFAISISILKPFAISLSPFAKHDENLPVVTAAPSEIGEERSALWAMKETISRKRWMQKRFGLAANWRKTSIPGTRATSLYGGAGGI
jgi:hypothetical protein